MHLEAGNPVLPARTSARYSLCLRRISSMRSGLFLMPRPLGSTPCGHCGPIPQYLQPVCKSPPNHAWQYLSWISRLQMGFSTTSAASKPWLNSGSSKISRKFFIFSMHHVRCQRCHLVKGFYLKMKEDMLEWSNVFEGHVHASMTFGKKVKIIGTVFICLSSKSMPRTRG